VGALHGIEAGTSPAPAYTGGHIGGKRADGHQALSVETDFWEAYERYVLKRGINEKTGLIKLRQWDQGRDFPRPLPLACCLITSRSSPQ